jgi:hypothetical protein
MLCKALEKPHTKRDTTTVSEIVFHWHATRIDDRALSQWKRVPGGEQVILHNRLIVVRSNEPYGPLNELLSSRACLDPGSSQLPIPVIPDPNRVKIVV